MRWFGQHISAEGIRFGPRHISGLKNMAITAISSELLQFTSATQYIRTSISEFLIIIKTLLDTLDSAYNKVGKRTKRPLERISLDSFGWDLVEVNAFHKCKEALCNRFLLAQRDHTKRFCFYVDASDTHWACRTTQI